MKQWLNTPVTYGCIIRLLLICGFIFLIFVAAIVAVFNVGGPHWTAISATTLTVIGVLIALGQWLIPIGTAQPEQKQAANTNNTNFEQALVLLHEREKSKLNEASSSQETGTLVVWCTKEKRGASVYLLPRGDFLSCKTGKERDNHRQKRIATITGERIGIHLLYVAIFRGLKPGRYNIWTAWNKDHPKSPVVEIRSGEIFELELNWQD